jgi:hypothetical protein
MRIEPRVELREGKWAEDWVLPELAVAAENRESQKKKAIKNKGKKRLW